MHIKTMRYIIVMLLTVSHSSIAMSDFTIDQLDWLSGCWQHEDGEPGSAEIWSAPSGGLMQGMSRTVRQGVAVSTEFMMILKHKDHWIYRAMPSGQSETDFTLVSASSSVVRFENPDHDFPTAIEYRLQSDPAGQSLQAVISSGEGGRYREIEFPMRSVNCTELLQ